MNKFRKRDKPVDSGPSGADSLGRGKRNIPPWMKMIIFAHIIMTYGIIVAHGIGYIPFSLNDAPLVALIISGLGSSLGLVYKQVAKVLGALPQIKSGL